MAENFEAKKLDASTINNGKRYEAGDGVTPEAVNGPIEAVLALQARVDELRPEGGGTVEVDPTLSIEGKAADAKATGDALSGKVDKIIDNETGYWLYGYQNIKNDDGSYTVTQNKKSIATSIYVTSQGNIAQYWSESFGDTAPRQGGFLYCQTPTRDYHAANKLYVDEKFSDGSLRNIKVKTSANQEDYIGPGEQGILVSNSAGDKITYIGADNAGDVPYYYSSDGTNTIMITPDLMSQFSAAGGYVWWTYPTMSGELLTDTIANKKFVATVETAWRIYGTRDYGVQSVYTLSSTGSNGAIPQYSRNATLKSVGTPAEDNDLVNLKYLNDEGYLHYVNTTGYEVCPTIKADNTYGYKIFSTQTPAGSVAVRDTGGVLRAKTLGANEWELMCINYGQSTLKDFILKGGNLIPIPLSYTIDRAADNPIEYTVDAANGTITANGTSSKSSAVKCRINSLRAGTYTYTIQLVSGSFSNPDTAITLHGHVQLYNGNVWVKNFGSAQLSQSSTAGSRASLQFTLTESDIPSIMSDYNLRVNVYLIEGTTANNVVIKPYLHAGNAFTGDATYGGGLVVRGQDLKLIAESVSKGVTQEYVDSVSALYKHDLTIWGMSRSAEELYFSYFSKENYEISTLQDLKDYMTAHGRLFGYNAAENTMQMLRYDEGEDKFYLNNDEVNVDETTISFEVHTYGF